MIDATIEELRNRLAETEETLRAIRSGEVDALVIDGAGEGDVRIYTLKGAEEPYRILVERMQEGALTVMANGDIVYANRCFAELVATPLERVSGRPLRSFIAERQHSLFDATMAHAMQGVRVELALVRDDGSEVPALLSASGLPLDGISAIGIIVTDLTEQQRQNALAASERFAKAVLDQTTEPMLVCDDQCSISRASGAATVLAGRDPIGLRLTEAFDFGAPDMGATVEGHIHAAIAGKVAQGVEVKIRAGEGKRYFLLSAGPLASGLADMSWCIVTLTDITSRKLAEQRQELLLRELSHRVKNAIAVVGSIATLSLGGDRPLGEARHSFLERLKALANTQDLLTGTFWQSASLGRLIAAETTPFGGRVSTSGDDMMLGAKAAQMLGLALHELGTNAAKHGALSVPDGRVEIGWETVDGEDGPTFRLVWRETGGPRVLPPVHNGFGRLLLERAVPYDVKGRGRLDYGAGGLCYTLETALDQLLAPAANEAARG